jgi:fermentation-respiration switch protein FrsA (DUF1100 family)
MKRQLMTWAAPVAAVCSGIASHFWDPRQALLLPMGLAVLATSFAVAGEERGWRVFGFSVAIGAGAWALEQTTYVLAHVVAGEPFDAERFGPQWAQAIGLIAAHALFLGTPTGALAGLLLNVPPLRAVRTASG